MMTAFSASRMSDAAHSHPSSEIIANLALERADFRLDVQLQLPGRGVTALFGPSGCGRSEEHTSELQSHLNLVCRLLLEKKKAERPAPIRKPTSRTCSNRPTV